MLFSPEEDKAKVPCGVIEKGKGKEKGKKHFIPSNSKDVFFPPSRFPF